MKVECSSRGMNGAPNVDGIPLVIKLAAAQDEVLGLREIARSIRCYEGVHGQNIVPLEEVFVSNNGRRAFFGALMALPRLVVAALAVGCLVSSTPAFASDGDAGVFDKWLNPDAPECVPVSAFKSVSTVTDLTPEQFQFVRALYVAIPPVSRKLPPGDHAVMASSGGAVMVALVADGQACARFLAPDFIQTMLVQVGQGMIVGLGAPL